jgi:hypothetical protein
MGTPLGDLGIDRMTTRITSALDEVQATARTLAVT